MMSRNRAGNRDGRFPKIGADREADEILAKLPRGEENPKIAPNAVVYVDATGRLNILLVGGGWLGINENNLGYVNGDGIYDKA
jgi:hypothetical protein